MNTFSKNRLEAFSDGVFAIVVTLLVLELKVPEVHDPVMLRMELVHLIPKFISWIISFAVVVIFWVNHHRFFHTLRQVDHNMLWLNGLYLLFISFVPFPTALMGEYIQDPLAVSFFGAALMLASLSASVMRVYATNKKMHDVNVDHVQAMKVAHRSFLFGPILYLAAAGLAWLHPYLAVVVYALIPVYFVLPKQLHR